jgi:hypothetical protein
MPDVAAAPSPTPTAPATPAPVASITPAAPNTGSVAPLSREAARSSILQDAKAGIEKIVADPNAAATPSASGAVATSTASGDASTTPAAAAATTDAKPGDALEIHPEAGPSAELGSLKLRFKGGDGQYVPIPDTLASQKFELQVGGKTYVKDLAGFGRLAADGIANARHATENNHLRTQVVPQMESQLGTLQQQLEAQIALNREILSDENRYAARRQEFSQLNSPEQRAQRAETALEERDRLDTERTQSQQHVAYYRDNVLPALTSVFTASPTVTNEEVMGRIALETQHLLQNGVIPPANYPKFVDYLTKTLAPWASGLHGQRSQADTARKQAEERAEADRRRTTQAAQNADVGRSLAPVAPAAATPITPGTTTQSPPRNRAEARRQIIESASQLAT